MTGYSTRGSVICLCVGAASVIILVGLSFTILSPDMPLVSCCSIAISASCHRPTADVDASLLPVQWGVVNDRPDGISRCTFTTLRTVRSPENGEEIAGKRDDCEITWEEAKPRRARKYSWVKAGLEITRRAKATREDSGEYGREEQHIPLAGIQNVRR